MSFWESGEGIEDGGIRSIKVSASARYGVVIEGVGLVMDAFKELHAAQKELDRLNQAAYNEEGVENEQWETVIELVENAPIRVRKSLNREIGIEPVDEQNEQAVHSVKKIKQIYSRIKVLNDLKKKGYDKVKEQKLSDGSIRLVVQKWQ